MSEEPTRGILYLVPTPLGDGPLDRILPPGVRQAVSRLSHFVVEHPRTARRFLKQIGTALPLQHVQMAVLDEHTPASGLAQLLEPARRGEDMGLMSEAGCPAVADPGAALVRLAHAERIRVVPLVGPSSILLALMASGLNGQRFGFHGYLPVKTAERTRAIAELERDSRSAVRTQIVIETPYRNRQLLESFLQACRGDTLLCVASNLTQPDESVATQPVAGWKNIQMPDLDGKPSVFLLQAQPPTLSAGR